ncbi:MAG: hypothetical protein HZB38_14845 [Planctomycetes bacterium]|nr:hypothetical protein [Planctomycetota bacterium]
MTPTEIPAGSGMRVFHVRTGECTLTARVAAWVAAHVASCAEANDPYAACAHLLTRPDDVPDLILVGLDWLAEDEIALLGYLRETWPGAVLVGYSQAPTRCIAVHDPLTRFVQTSDELDGMLAKTPAEFARACRRAVSAESNAAETPDPFEGLSVEMPALIAIELPPLRRRSAGSHADEPSQARDGRYAAPSRNEIRDDAMMRTDLAVLSGDAFH